MKLGMLPIVLGSVGLALALIGPAQAYDGEEYVVCRLNPYGDNYLSLRTCGSTKCRAVRRLGPNTPLRSWNPSGVRGWRKVDVLPYLGAPHRNYLSGWVYQKYICRVRY